MNQARTEKTHILILTTAYQPLIGGSEIAIREVTRRLPDVFFDIVTPKYEQAHESYEEFDNVAIHRIGPGGIISKWLFPFFGALHSRSLLSKDRHSLVHVWQASWAGGAGWFLKKIMRRTVLLVTIQEGEDLEKQSWFVRTTRRMILRSANHITAISSYLKEYVSSQVSTEVSVIPNGISEDLLTKKEDKKVTKDFKGEWKIKDRQKIIFSISRLTPKNAMDTLIRAMARLSDNMKLVIVGSGPDMGALKYLARSLEIEDRVVFAGKMNNEKAIGALRAADIFVRPSRSEGLGIAFLEAMAVGIPVVATRVGGIPDFLEDEKTGLSVSVDDSDALAIAIERLLKDKSLRESIVKRAKELISKKYRWDLIAKKYKKIYETFDNSSNI